MRIPFPKPWLSLIALLLLALVTVLLFKTALVSRAPVAVAPVRFDPIDASAASARLAGALRLRTVSLDEQPDANADQFAALHDYLRMTFPRVHAAMRIERFNTHTLLYTWPGSDPSLSPVMLMAHQDVVPVADDADRTWTHPPFSGEIADGHVWGRGAWDDKGSLLAQLEAAERMLARGVHPERTILFAFGHDEELGGERGNRAVAEALAARGTRLEFVLDEGMPVTRGVLGGVDAPVALIGIAEKGLANLHLRAHAADGHSSAPARDSAIGNIATALSRIQNDPMPAAFDGVPKTMLRSLAPRMQGAGRVVISNDWLFSPLIQRQLSRSPATDAMLRTTLALTQVDAGVKSNVLPAEATANINVRLKPGDSIEDVLDHVRRSITGTGVEVTVAPPVQIASPVSSTQSRGYGVISRALEETTPGVAIAPALVIGGTDARHMQTIAGNVYRISPVIAQPSDLPRFHGTDERIAVRDYVRIIRFYERVLTLAAVEPTAPAPARAAR